MKVSVETINGKLCTVLYHCDGDARRINLLGRRFTNLTGGAMEFFKDADCLEHIATALPALPCHPESQDTSLLYKYASEGIFAFLQGDAEYGPLLGPAGLYSCYAMEDIKSDTRITHAVDAQGNKVEIAIFEDKGVER